MKIKAWPNKGEIMEYYNDHFRMEIKGDFAYIRALNEDGCGVISAILKPRALAAFTKLCGVFTHATTFSEAWDIANTVKGANFEYRSY